MEEKGRRAGEKRRSTDTYFIHVNLVRPLLMNISTCQYFRFKILLLLLLLAADRKSVV